MFYRSIGVFLILVTVLFDQYSKKKILLYFIGKINRNIPITDFLNLCLVWNKGISFGLFNNYENARIIFLIISLIIVLFLMYYLYYAKNFYHSVSFGLIIGGAIGNMIDRYNYGAVIDFIDVYYLNYHWPAFNIADSVIVIGTIILLFEKKDGL